MVGSGAGQALHEQQGTGLATVLQGNEALRTAQAVGMDRVRQAAAERLKREQERDAAIKSLTSFSPEYWYRHSAEMQSAIDGVFNEGARLLSKKGVTNPWVGTSPQEIEFQKNASRVKQMAMASKQAKDVMDQFNKDLSLQDPSTFETESILAGKAFSEASLADIASGKVKPPVLVKRTPFQDNLAAVKPLMADLEAKHGDRDVPEADMRDMARNAVLNPDFYEKAERSYSTALARMDEGERRLFMQRAADAGVSPVEQGIFEDMGRVQKAKKPFEYDSELSKRVDALDESTRSWSDGERSGSVTAPVGAKQAALNWVMSDPRVIRFWSDKKGIKQGVDENDTDYMGRIAGLLAKEMTAMKGTKRSSATTLEAGKGQEAQQSTNRWYTDVTGESQPDAQNAAKSLVGGSYAGTGVIQDARVEFSDAPSNGGGAKGGASESGTAILRGQRGRVSHSAAPREMVLTVQSKDRPNVTENGSVTQRDRETWEVRIPVEEGTPNADFLKNMASERFSTAKRSYEGMPKPVKSAFNVMDVLGIGKKPTQTPKY